MADRDRDRDRFSHQLQVHPQHHFDSQRGPSASQVIAVITLLPVGGTLLALAGITLVGSLIGLAVTTPLFLLFSPVIVPAALVFGLAVTGFMSSGAFGITGLSSLSWLLNYFRQATGTDPLDMDQAKRRMQEAAGYVGQKTKELGQGIQNKAHEVGRT